MFVGRETPLLLVIVIKGGILMLGWSINYPIEFQISFEIEFQSYVVVTSINYLFQTSLQLSAKLVCFIHLNCMREVDDDSLLAMKERAKAFPDFNSCNKHPYSPSSVGICPLCLSDRLMTLACSDCGERRVSSCSCSEFSSSDSFLIDNDDHKRRPSFLRSSSSSSSSNGFWRMLRKRRNKDSEMGSLRNNIVDEQYGFWRNGYGARDEMEDERGGFIELKLDSWYDGVGVVNTNNNIASLRRNGINSGSCRITMKEKGLKQEQGKLWKWISKFR